MVRILPRRHDPTKPLVPGGNGAVPLAQAVRLAPLGDLAADPRAVRRKVDRRGQVSFVGRYYHASREWAGQTVLVRCEAGVVQVVTGVGWSAPGASATPLPRTSACTSGPDGRCC